MTSPANNSATPASTDATANTPLTASTDATASTAVTVKICGLTSADDARCALACGTDYCGMILFERSPRFISEQTIRTLLDVIPAGKRVFVDVAPAAEKLSKHAALGFDKFQIHCEADTPAQTLRSWAQATGRQNLWLAPRIAPGAAFPEHLLEFADTFLIDTFQKSGAHGGSGQTGDWQQFRKWREQYKAVQFILAGGLGPTNLAEAINRSGTTFVDLNSGLETAPGQKDHTKIRAALRLAGKTALPQA